MLERSNISYMILGRSETLKPLGTLEYYLEILLDAMGRQIPYMMQLNAWLKNALGRFQYSVTFR